MREAAAMPARRVGGLLMRLVLRVALALAPAAPALAATQTLNLWLGGRETTVDVFVPASDSPARPRDAVILAHGFTRDRNSMTGHAERLAALGLVVAVPDLPYYWHSGDNARALRDLVRMLLAGKFAPTAPRVVLVGFSAGGLAALLAADEPGVVGYIGLDPFDRPGGIGREAARKLEIPAYLLRAPASRCNAFAIAEPWKDVLPKLQSDRVIAEATHCDFEWPTDGLCRAACGGSDDARRKLIADALSAAVRAMLPPRAP
jgi:pimeloyl-ACP methyl ester carboxylesterase